MPFYLMSSHHLRHTCSANLALSMAVSATTLDRLFSGAAVAKYDNKRLVLAPARVSVRVNPHLVHSALPPSPWPLSCPDSFLYPNFSVSCSPSPGPNPDLSPNLSVWCRPHLAHVPWPALMVRYAHYFPNQTKLSFTVVPSRAGLAGSELADRCHCRRP